MVYGITGAMPKWSGVTPAKLTHHLAKDVATRILMFLVASWLYLEINRQNDVFYLRTVYLGGIPNDQMPFSL